MTLRASVLAATAVALLLVPLAAHGETCADRAARSISDMREVTNTVHPVDMEVMGLGFGRAVLRDAAARAVIANQDAENLNTLDAFLPPDDTKLQQGPSCRCATRSSRKPGKHWRMSKRLARS